MGFSRKLSHLFLLISLPAILWLFYNQTVNWHYHILGNGIVIEHAHPFASSTLPGTPFQQHQHSDLEYSFLAQVSNVLTLLVAFMVLAILFKSHVMPSLQIPIRIHASWAHFPFHPHRGPPFLV